jgi:hypothetical protein
MVSANCKWRWLSLVALASVIIAGPAPAQEVLRYKFKQGEKLHYVLEQKMNMTMAIMNNNIMMDMTQTIDTLWDIQSVDKDGTAKMTQKFDRVRFSMDGPMGKTEYDSKDGKVPEGPFGALMGPFFQALAGAEFKVTLDAHGQYDKVEVPDKLAEALKKLPMASAMGDLASVDGLKRLISQSGLILPNTALTKGKTWDKKIDIKLPFGKMETDTAFTYQGPTTHDGLKVEQFAMKPKMTIEPDPNANMKAKIKSQDNKGAAYFDATAGRLVETEVTQKTEMEVSAGGQDFTQKIDQKVSFKLQQDKTKAK